MTKNFLVSILGIEDRLNKIVEVLALSRANHFQVGYTIAEVEIDAYTHKSTEAQQTENLLRCFATKEDQIETVELEDSNGKFWVTKLHIEI